MSKPNWFCDVHVTHKDSILAGRAVRTRLVKTGVGTSSSNYVGVVCVHVPTRIRSLQ